MKIEDYKITGGLNKEQIEKMHDNALWLCENVGINVPHDGIVDILSGYGGVRVEENTIVKLSELIWKEGGIMPKKESVFPRPMLVRDSVKDEWEEAIVFCIDEEYNRVIARENDYEFGYYSQWREVEDE